MNDNSMGDDKTLILAYTRDDIVDCVPFMSMLKIGGSVVTVLGLDFGSWVELRRRNIPYKTPAEYLDRDKCAKIDAEARSFARSWYEPIADKVIYNGISLGAMVEYDFSHLFIDALRAIEIARCIIAQEKPNKILLPRNVPRSRANAVRYEALPDALLHFSESMGICISYVEPNRGVKPRQTKLMKKTGSLVSDPIRVLARIYRDVRYWGTLRIRRLIRGEELRKAYVFLDVPDQVFFPVKRHLEAGLRDAFIRISSSRIASSHKSRHQELRKNLLAMLERLENSHQTYENVPLGKVLSRRYAQFLTDDCPKLARHIEGAKEFIIHVKPSIVVTNEDVTPTHRAIMRVCRTCGIPTLVIQHGILGPDLGGFHVMPVEADKQAVWDTRSKEWAITRGKPSESQVITGNPRYDSISTTSRSHERAMAIFRKLGLDARTGIVVIATTWYQAIASCYVPEDDEAFVARALAAMKSFPEKSIVLKLHPSYSKEYEAMTRSIIEQVQLRNVVVTDRFLWELLDVCDLLITDVSSVGLEAVLFDKPVIVFNAARDANLNPYLGADFVINIKRSEDLVLAIRDALYNGEVRRRLNLARRRYVSQYALCRDGKASQRVGRLIEQMICCSAS